MERTRKAWQQRAGQGNRGIHQYAALTDRNPGKSPLRLSVEECESEDNEATSQPGAHHSSLKKISERSTPEERQGPENSTVKTRQARPKVKVRKSQFPPTTSSGDENRRVAEGNGI